MLTRRQDGLAAARDASPGTRAKMDVRDWIEQCLESLQTQKDSIEAELEVIRSKQKKNSKGPTEREVELDTLRERHNYHVSRLELTLRLLDNDNLSVDDINNVKDDVNYYIESNQDPDFQVRKPCRVRSFLFLSVLMFLKTLLGAGPDASQGILNGGPFREVTNVQLSRRTTQSMIRSTWMTWIKTRVLLTFSRRRKRRKSAESGRKLSGRRRASVRRHARQNSRRSAKLVPCVLLRVMLLRC